MTYPCLEGNNIRKASIPLSTPISDLFQLVKSVAGESGEGFDKLAL